MFEEVAANDAAMSEIRTVVAIKIASHPVATVEPAAIKIALAVVKVASLLHIGAIMPCKLPALVASNVAVPGLLIVESAALRALGKVRAS